MSQIAFKSNTVPRMTTTTAYDYLNRLSSISAASASSPLTSFGYVYNCANQRTRATVADGSYWLYDYDALGQVRSGRKYWSDGTPVAGQQFEYGHDDIGNRTGTKAGGDENGWNLRPASYTANKLNQYASRDVPGAVDVMGLALATNTVTVNNQSTYRKGEYFRKELNVGNASSALWTNISVAAAGESTVSGNVFVPQTPEAFYHDLDGNLTNDGRWVLSWDAENRLMRMESRADAPSGSKLKLLFGYDAQGRRISKTVSNWVSGAWQLQSTNRFVYDGWNLLAILNAQSSILASFTWGLDLSGSLQGAGGVGGLLQVTYCGAQRTNCFVAYDGNGNVAALVNAADGNVVARYEYGPFGEPLRATGPMAKANAFRFSTKYQDDETDLLYYGYRFYNQSTGRWLSRDPIADAAFFATYTAGRSSGVRQSLQWRSLDQPYLFCQNSPAIYYDPDGCVAPVLIFSVGRAISHGILACYYCYHLEKCLATAHDYAKRAAAGMEPDTYLQWLKAAKPGSECTQLAEGCGVNVIQLAVWVGARFLILRYNVMNPIVK